MKQYPKLSKLVLCSKPKRYFSGLRQPAGDIA